MIAWLQWAAGHSLADGEWRTAAHLEAAAFSLLNQTQLHIVHLYIFVLFCNSFHSVLSHELHDLRVQLVAGHVTFERHTGSI